MVPSCEEIAPHRAWLVLSETVTFSGYMQPRKSVVTSSLVDGPKSSKQGRYFCEYVHGTCYEFNQSCRRPKLMQISLIRVHAWAADDVVSSFSPPQWET